METNKLVAGIVAAAIAIIVLAGVLMPALSNATQTHETFVNEGLYYLTNPTETMTVEYLGSNAWEIDGEPLVYTIQGSTNILIFDDIFIRNNGQVRGSATMNWDSAELTVSAGTVTGTAVVSGNSTAISWTYSTAFVATNDSDSNWIMKINTDKSYIKGDSEVIGMGMSQVKNNLGENALIACYVTVEGIDNVTVTSANTNVTISDVQVNITPVDGFIDLYKFESVTFKSTWGTYTSNVTYNTVIVPHEVTAEKSQHLTDAMNVILNVIPLLIIVAVLLGVVAVFILRRE